MAPAYSWGSPHHFVSGCPLSLVVPASTQWKVYTVLNPCPEIKFSVTLWGLPTEPRLCSCYLLTVIVLFRYKLILLSKYLIIICSLEVNILLFAHYKFVLILCLRNSTFLAYCVITNLELMKSELVALAIIFHSLMCSVWSNDVTPILTHFITVRRNLPDFYITESWESIII